MRVLAASFFLVQVLSACSPEPPPAEPGEPQPQVIGGLEYWARTAVLESFPVQLRTNVTVTNRTAGEASITFPDGCVVLLRAHRGARPVEPPAWDQGRAVACTMALIEVTLAPGESRTFTTGASAAEILGDSLPTGRYSLSVYLRPMDRASVALPAGEVELAR